MKNYPLHEILKKNNLLDYSHTLIFRFFERKCENHIVISATEIYHLGKNIRLLNSSMILQSIYDVPTNKIHASLDGINTLYEYFEHNKYTSTKKAHNEWAENILTFQKKIDVNNLEFELYKFFNFYRTLCIDNNMPVDVSIFD